jgi:diguanylate cyclase (GGDEF)-like protein
MKQLVRHLMQRVSTPPIVSACSVLVGVGAVIIVFGFIPRSLSSLLAGGLASLAIVGAICCLNYRRQLRSVIQELGALNKDLTFETKQRRAAEKALEFHIEKDTLTRLATFRYFISRSELAFARARRSGKPMSVVFFAIDRFDTVEEKLGPVGADNIIRTTATICRHAVREVDLPAWYERNMFAVLLEETASDDAKNVVDRLRQRLEAIPVSDKDDSERISVSMSLVQMDANRHSLNKGLTLGRDALEVALAEGPKGFRLATIPTEDGGSQSLNEEQSAVARLKAA